MSNTEKVIENFKARMVEIQEEEEVWFEKIREQALKENRAYPLYDKKASLIRIEKAFLDKEYIRIWFWYFLYIARRNRKINEGEQTSLLFFKQIVIPTMESTRRSSRNFKMPVYLENLILELSRYDMFEEIQMIKYSAQIDHHFELFSILECSLIYPIASKVEGYSEFCKDNDPRMH